MEDTVVIITQKLDPHTDAVIDEIEKCGLVGIRVHTEDILSNWDITMNCQDIGSSFLFLKDSKKKIEFSRIRSVYYRKPLQPQAESFSENDSINQFLYEEAIGLRNLLYQFLGEKFFNNPFTSRKHSHKIYQMRVARSLKLNVPRAVLTNNFEEARNFFSETGCDCVLKPISGASALKENKLLRCFVKPVSFSELEKYEKNFELCPVIIQEKITKKRDIRVTVIKDQVIACAIYSQQHPDSISDWRKVDPDELRHEIICLPGDIVEKLLKLQKLFEVPFGAIDLVEDVTGNFWFLENNLNGQWYWIELLTQEKLAHKVAKALIEKE